MRLLECRVDVADLDALIGRLDAIGAEHGCAVGAFDARYVAGRDHLRTAVERANRAWDRDDAIADDRGMEILLYAAGRRQIDRALEMGLPARGPGVIVIDGDAEAEAAAAVRELAGIEPAGTVGECRDEGRIRSFFDIDDPELAATTADLEALVCERVALLTVEK